MDPGDHGLRVEAASYRYPTIVRRYFSTVIDFCLAFGCVGAVGLLQLAEERVVLGRTMVLVAYFGLYEPLLTSRGCTVGQWLLRLRVRRSGAPDESITIGKAYLRYFVKCFFGTISFVTIPFTRRQRAIHDFAADSMMVRV